MSRSGYVKKNILYSMCSKIVALVLHFISRTVFIKILGNTYLGVNGLYTSLLSLLSFAELGFGTAITFLLYKPVAENNEEQTLKILYFYKIAHRIVAGIIFGVGLIFVPFLPYIVKDADFLTQNELYIYFLIYLTNSVITYFVSYKYGYVRAKQQIYIVTNIDTIFQIIIVSAQIFVMILTKNFLFYLLTQTILIIVSKIFIALYLNRRFPIVHKKPTTFLSKEEKKPIYKEVRGLIVHRFADIAVHSTDNILISVLVGGVALVGLVSNYDLLITSVLGFVTILFSSLTPSFGNLMATSSSEKSHAVFEETNFIGSWIYGFCAIAFYILIPPFITLWIGSEYVIDSVSFSLIILNCYLQGLCTVYNNVRIAKGGFGKDKWNALCQALVNLVVSIIAAKFLGLVGIYIGTICSRMVIVIGRPKATYRHLFGTSSKFYYVKTLMYGTVSLVLGLITYVATYYILKDVTILKFIAAACVVAILPNLLYALIFIKNKQFKSVVNRVSNMFKLKFVKTKRNNNG